MPAFDTTLPPLMATLHQIEVDYDDGDGIDFEPREAFESADENAAWIRAWTNNKTLDGAEYRIFGADGTGGNAAIWLARPGADLLDQPIVFFGSEGELGVVAYDFADYLWMLAAGIGPMEAVGYGADEEQPNAEFTAFAEQHAKAAKKSAAAALSRAQEAFPTFEEDFLALCKNA